MTIKGFDRPSLAESSLDGFIYYYQLHETRVFSGDHRQIT